MASSVEGNENIEARTPEDIVAMGFSTGATLQSLMLNDETLTSLNLSGVMLGEHRTMGLLRILTEHNTSLTSLKLDGNSGASCGQEQMQQVSRMLKCNTGLRHLSIFGSSVSDEDVGMLGEALEGKLPPRPSCRQHRASSAWAISLP